MNLKKLYEKNTNQFQNKNNPRNSLGFFIGKNNFADMKKNVSLLSQT